MSRNFDLMQQLEIDRGPHPTESVAPVFPTSPGNANRNGHVEWASDEALRLVQQIFLLQTQEPPRVVVFAGIDHGNGCSRICESCGRNVSNELTKASLPGRSKF